VSQTDTELLKQSADRWHALFDNNPMETIVVDHEGRITDVNAAKREAGNRLPAVGDRMYIDYASQHAIDMRAELMHCIEAGDVKDMPELTYGDKVLSVMIAPFSTGDHYGAVITSQDITERKKAHSDFENIFTLSQDMICVATDRGGFLNVSPSCEAILGYTVSEILKLDWTDLIHPDDMKPTQDRVEAQLKGNDTANFINRYRCKDGSYKTLEWHATFAKNGNVYGVARDISQRLAVETQLHQSQKLKSLGTMAGGVAHEINNPINGIMNYAQLILDELGPDTAASGFAAEIEKETRRVSDIVKSLLTFSRPPAQQATSIRMCDIVASSLSLLRSLLLTDKITLEVNVPEDLPTVECRTQQIQQVLINLITNARDALNDKYPKLDEDKLIRISAKTLGSPKMSSSSRIRLTIEDHGPGIAKKEQELLFDPFYTSKRPDKGSGLGLSISHAIVTDHGGEIGVESKVGEWTRFHVDLPADKGGTDEMPKA
jgi:PAS domain S-box-containing protein